MKSKNKELLKNTFIIFVGRFCTQFISFLLIPLYTKYLLTSDYGYVDLLQTYISLFIPILILRSDSSIFRFMIDERNKKENQSKIITSILFLILIQIIIFILISSIFNIIFSIKYFVAIIINTIVWSITNIYLQLTRGIGDNIGYSIASILTAFVSLFLNYLLIVFFEFGGESILIASAASNLVCIVYLTIRNKIFRFIRKNNFSMKKLKEMLKFSVPMIPDGLSWWVINVSDRTIISFMINASANGIYAVSSKFSNILSSIYQIFNMSWQESSAVHIDDDDREEFFSGVLNNTYKIFYSICLIIMVVMPFVFIIAIGKDYQSASLYIPILLLSNLFNAIANILGGIYIAKKDTKNVARTTLMSAFLNIVINILLINKVGLWAAAFSTLISYIILFVYRFVDVKKYINLSFNFKFLIISLLLFIINTFIYYYNNFYLNIINLVFGLVEVILFNKENIAKGFKMFILKK